MASHPWRLKQLARTIRLLKVANWSCLINIPVTNPKKRWSTMSHGETKLPVCPSL